MSDTQGNSGAGSSGTTSSGSGGASGNAGSASGSGNAGDEGGSTVDQLVAKATEMKDKVSSVQGEITSIEKEGEAAGGMVKAVCDGNGTLKSIKIDPSLMDGEAAVLEELVVNAVASARAHAQEEAGQKVNDLLGGLPIPSSITQMIAQFIPSAK